MNDHIEYSLRRLHDGALIYQWFVPIGSNYASPPFMYEPLVGEYEWMYGAEKGRFRGEWVDGHYKATPLPTGGAGE